MREAYYREPLIALPRLLFKTVALVLAKNKIPI